MSTADDGYADWDAAYVLGALSPKERYEFEAHLAGCAGCRDMVAELAGMPGLLAHVPAGDVVGTFAPRDSDGDGDGDGDESPDPAPERGDSAAGRRNRRGPLLAVAASVALVLGGGVGYAAHDLLSRDTGRPAVGSAPARVAFSPVVASPLTAVVDVVPTSSGTELRVECQYAAAGGAQPEGTAADYALYVTDRSGTSRLAKSWTVRPDRVMRPTVSSPLPVEQIAAIEIREVDSGQILARARL